MFRLYATFQCTVVVPPGVYGGETINVMAPDGTGRVVAAVVPNGMGPGSQFQVRFPPSFAPSAPPEPKQELYKPDFSTATANGSGASYPMAAATLVNEAEEPPPFSMALDLPPPTMSYSPDTGLTQSAEYQSQPQTYQQTQQSTSLSPGQKLVRVRVPPGVAPGTTIQVGIPDEPGRVLTAQVPPNATEFNVAYYPSSNLPTVAASSSSYTYNNNNNNNYPTTASMPPVPSYNSYPPNNNNYNRYNNNNNNRYNNNNNNYNNGYNNNNNNNRPGIGGLILPVLGGAAIGAAAMELLDGDGFGDW